MLLETEKMSSCGTASMRGRQLPEHTVGRERVCTSLIGKHTRPGDCRARCLYRTGTVHGNDYCRVEIINQGLLQKFKAVQYQFTAPTIPQLGIFEGTKSNLREAFWLTLKNESALCGSKFARSSGMVDLHRHRDTFFSPPRAKLAKVENCKGSKSISG